MSVLDEAEERFSGSRIQYGCIFVTSLSCNIFSVCIDGRGVWLSNGGGSRGTCD